MHEITIVLFNEETRQGRVLSFRGEPAEIKVSAFDEQVRMQDEGFFLVRAKIAEIEGAA